jgi:hypothetical protein
MQKLFTHTNTNLIEGYVVRTIEAFSYETFDLHVAKWVRPNHITSDEHWMNKEIIPNRLGVKRQAT